MKIFVRRVLYTLATICMAVAARADDWPQWRGPHRDGISKERGLLAQWPAQGPKLLWHTKEAGTGYSTPSVVGQNLYLLGSQGVESESVRAFSIEKGATLWSTSLGKVGNPDQQPHYPGARSTPTVDGDHIFALSSDGDLASLDKKTGKIIWQKNLRTDFGGKPGQWAYSESPLVDGGLVVCTPGGADATIVALQKKDGAVVWKSAVPGGDDAAYASIILLEHHGVKQYVQLLSKGLVGIEARSGKFLWRYDKAISRFKANIPTPVVHENAIYAASAGTGGGVVKLKFEDGKVTPEQAYFSPKLPTAIGGTIALGDYLYGAGAKSLMCLEFNTGDVKWQQDTPGPAALCFAEGNLYLHGENGDVSLVEATATGFHEKGHFTPPDAPAHSNDMEKSWAYPVVANGRLYIRDHASLWCYDIKAR